MKIATTRLRHQGIIVQLLALTLTISLAGCGGSLYKVAPAPNASAPLIEGAKGTEVGGISVRAIPLVTDEESQELFEANLLLAGLLPVRIELNNNANTPLDFKRVRFHLRDDTGREWKARTPKQSVARILDANEIYLYNPNSRKKFLEAFTRHTLNTATPLATAERRQGLIFFQTPKKEAVASPRNLTLSIEGLPQPIELRLN
jgi:hypothetical protein